MCVNKVNTRTSTKLTITEIIYTHYLKILSNNNYIVENKSGANMTLYSSILGVPIISSKNNSIIGVVKEVLYCSKKYWIIGLIVEEGSIFAPIRYIPAERIKEVNETTVVTDSSDCIESIRNYKDYCSKLENYTELSINAFVYFKKGTLLGQVKDILFNFEKNNIEGFIISKSYFEDIFSNRIVLNNIYENDENLNKFITMNY